MPGGAKLGCFLTSSTSPVEETSASQDDSDNSVSESLDDCDYSVAEISRSFRSQQELCEQLNINHMIQRIFLITLDNSEYGELVPGIQTRRNSQLYWDFCSFLRVGLQYSMVAVDSTQIIFHL